MNGYAATYSGTRYTPNEPSVLFRPRHPKTNKRAVLYAHGANGSAIQVLDGGHNPSLTKFVSMFAIHGFVVMSCDFGGPQTYGNDTELAAMEAAWAWLQASDLCATDKVLLTGGSMGSLSCHRFAFEHPDEVAAMGLWIPALDIEDLRNRDALGTRNLIDTAWGLPTGSYLSNGDAPVPTRGKPMDHVATYDPIPTRLMYSTGDTVTTSAAVDAYISARTSNVQTEITSTTADHGDGAVAPTDIEALLAFLDTNA